MLFFPKDVMHYKRDQNHVFLLLVVFFFINIYAKATRQTK